MDVKRDHKPSNTRACSPAEAGSLAEEAQSLEGYSRAIRSAREILLESGHDALSDLTAANDHLGAVLDLLEGLRSGISSLNPELIVREYYSRIDKGDIDWVVEMFAPDGRYNRAGVVYNGPDGIRDFYENERKVMLKHSDLNFWRVGNHIFVEGTFDGHGLDGSKKQGQFADHWVFNNSGKVSLRNTSLFTGAQYVKE